jgi:phosphoribosylamine--glycine ligase
MRILVIGSGGREHAIITKLSESERVSGLYCAPGNGGISMLAECFNVGASDIDGVVALSKRLSPDLVVVAPDAPLVAGMTDALNHNGIAAFGPSKRAALIEGSKVFAKELMRKHNIPTASFETFDDCADAVAYIKASNSYPRVIKADGLALGKGVIIARDEAQATAAVTSIMKEKIFGESGSKVVIEEYLEGREVSVLAFTDGVTVKPMVSSMDHKRAFDGDTGPNTGGMGVIAPNPFYTDEIADACMRDIFLPTVKALREDGRTFKGCLYFGLIITDGGVKVIEYNSRFGDPEAQAVLPLLETDLADIFKAVVKERLADIEITWKKKHAACVVLASGGYPLTYDVGYRINGLDENGRVKNAAVYHAGTKTENGAFYTASGRVLGVTAVGDTLEAALKASYAAAEGIDFEGKFYRKDIGAAALTAAPKGA